MRAPSPRELTQPPRAYGRISPDKTASRRILPLGSREHPPHQDRISPSALAALLQAIVGEGFERPELAMHTLAFWFHLHPPADRADRPRSVPSPGNVWRHRYIEFTKTHDGLRAPTKLLPDLSNSIRDGGFGSSKMQPSG